MKVEDSITGQYLSGRKKIEVPKKRRKYVKSKVIEVQGANIVKEKCPDAISIFIIPPSMEELEKRIRGRRSEAEEIIQQRLAKATQELKLVGNYKYVVCNDDPELAAEVIGLIIKRNQK